MATATMCWTIRKFPTPSTTGCSGTQDETAHPELIAVDSPILEGGRQTAGGICTGAASGPDAIQHPALKPTPARRCGGLLMPRSGASWT